MGEAPNADIALPGARAAIDAVRNLVPLDDTGHVTTCGYDETGDCGCSTLPVRLADLLLQAARVGRRATLDPGAFVKRDQDSDGDYERLDRWQERALLAALGRRIPPAKRDGEATS